MVFVRLSDVQLDAADEHELAIGELGVDDGVHLDVDVLIRRVHELCEGLGGGLDAVQGLADLLPA